MRISKSEVLEALGEVYSKKKLDKLLKLKPLTTIDALKIFSMSDYSYDILWTNLSKLSPQKRYGARERIKDTLEAMLITDEDIDVIRKNKEDGILSPNQVDVDAGRSRVEKVIESVSAGLSSSSDIYNMAHGELVDVIKGNDDEFSTENIINQYKQVFKALMRKAMGVAEEVEQTIAYIVDVDANGKIVGRKIKPNSDGDLVVVEKTKKLSADGKSFGEALIVLEIIQKLSSNANVYLTSDEEEERYISMIKRINSEKAMLSD